MNELCVMEFKSEVEIEGIKMDELSVMNFKSEVEIEEIKMDEFKCEGEI